MAAEDIEEVEEVEETEEEEVEDFDKERALTTIRAQRESEKKLKAELAEARKAQDELEEIKTKEADAQKSLADKLEERAAEIAALKNQIAERDIKEDFEREATARGIKDLDLAFLAAKEQGLLGKRDPKTGEVDKHDFETLEERFPTLAGETGGFANTGDAGRRQRGKTVTPGGQFNNVVRDAVSRR